VPNMPQQIEG